MGWNKYRDVTICRGWQLKVMGKRAQGKRIYVGRGQSLEGAWSDLTWQDEEDESTEETEKAQQGGRKKTGEDGVTEATGRNFTHSFIKHLLCQTFLGSGTIVVNAKFLDFIRNYILGEK